MGGILDRLEYLRSTNYSFGEGELKKLAIDIKIFGLKQVLYRMSTNKAKDKKRVNIKPELAFLYFYLKRENLIRIKDNAFDFRNSSCPNSCMITVGSSGSRSVSVRAISTK